ncbi:tryptophan synthase subunit beta [Candidatus Saccharibacteria bacterium]|uniref:Tryptophan synthase beta chain n=1 Tax=Candidatus Nanosyncoccus alces TaxID=2171997 RepID=A0ABY0FM20_9BACT|nr:tryptophan synthase subunit beta [Candidatus Nanosyncoccus alces]MBQ2643313.1 tryptophan synthase subunit beta [Candidatus Saccharibacteria bacterium]RYC74780.1 Tryptophan synthase beta chain [Candidatus Nanosyncoccus alces]
MKYSINDFPDKNGFYGKYGGSFLSPEMNEEFQRINDFYQRIRNDAEFIDELKYIRKHYQGRPTPITFAKNLTDKLGGAAIYLKREDLNHTGAHKLNHAMAYGLVAKKMGKTKIIADTGAGQHGVAMAAAAAYFGMECDIYMGKIDAEKEAPNVDRMKIMGTNVIVVEDGAGKLIDAAAASFAAYEKDYERCFYPIGSALGPAPIPQMVRDFQSIVGKEAREQFAEMTDGKMPNKVIAVVGGGSNAMGLFSGFIDNDDIELLAAEALGKMREGEEERVGEHAATATFGEFRTMSGFKSLALAEEDGTPKPAYSVASGLDYPGLGPELAYLKEIGRIKFNAINDEEAIDAFYDLSKAEGIIPALESSHALALAMKMAPSHPGETFLVNLSGRGDKDIEFVLNNFDK